jgi:hypothetical protein
MSGLKTRRTKGTLLAQFIPMIKKLHIQLEDGPQGPKHVVDIKIKLKQTS